TYLFGRRMYETMAVWETLETDEPVSRDFAELWRAADKIVYSTTLDAVSTSRTRLERSFDPDAVRQLKETAARDIGVGGATLAAQALAAGLVDEIQLYLTPVLVGGGTRALPDGVRRPLELRDEHRFRNGTDFLRYS